jgi:DNA-binding SARP family transcriptional activator
MTTSAAADGDAPLVFCRVLGPLQVEIDGVVTALGGPTPRRTLTALLAAEGLPLDDCRLAEQVWRRPPRDIPGALRVIVCRLRTALGLGARDYLRRSPAGYVFTIPRGWTDHGRFATQVEHGLLQLAGAEFASAIATFESALTLWRGEPWCDLADAPDLAGAQSRMSELREVAVEELLAARIACGEIAVAVAALHQAVRESPYRERRWELLALGLYRSGRQVHALDELRRVRELLRTDIGVDPGPELLALEQRMLVHDVGLLDFHPPRLHRTGSIATGAVRTA